MRNIITGEDIELAVHSGKKEIVFGSEDIITNIAHETAEKQGIRFVTGKVPVSEESSATSSSGSTVPASLWGHGLNQGADRNAGSGRKTPLLLISTTSSMQRTPDVLTAAPRRCPRLILLGEVWKSLTPWVSRISITGRICFPNTVFKAPWPGIWKSQARSI